MQNNFDNKSKRRLLGREDGGVRSRKKCYDKTCGDLWMLSLNEINQNKLGKEKIEIRNERTIKYFQRNWILEMNRKYA